MTDVDGPAGFATGAAGLARDLLGDLTERWRHTVGVARRAEQLTRAVPEADHDMLLAAAWLHDIGYAAAVRTSGFHPLDGARYLSAHRWPLRLAGLVAHHSEALAVARVRGLADELEAYPRERSAVADALTCADQTVGPNGHRMSIEQRLTDMLRRHGPDSPNAAAHPWREPRLRAAVHRVDRRLLGDQLAPAARRAPSSAS